MSAHCPVAQRCGACPLIGEDPARQRTRKTGEVGRLLSEAGLNVPLSFHPARADVSYRRRVRLRVNEMGRLVFFNAEKSDRCAVLTVELVEMLATVQCISHQRPDLFLPFASAELRAPDLDGFAGLLLVPRVPHLSDTERRRLYDQIKNVLPSTVLLDLRPQDPWQSGAISPGGAPVLQRVGITDEIFTKVPLFGFLQINHAINAALVTRVVEEAIRTGARRALDLYCGSGNFALPLAARGLDVHGIEAVPAGVLGAREAADMQRLHAHFHEGSAEAWAPFATRFRPDLVVCDPPRAGLKQSLDWILDLAPRHLFLCSCNPQSLVRDLGRLVTGGYVVQKVELLDMFPHTEHVEVLAVLKRGSDGRAPPSRQEPSPE